MYLISQSPEPQFVGWGECVIMEVCRADRHLKSLGKLNDLVDPVGRNNTATLKQNKYETMQQLKSIK